MTSPEARPLRIGILCNGPGLAAWQAECIRYIEALPFAQIKLLVVNAQPPSPRPAAWRRLRDKLASGLLLWRAYERFVLDRKAAATRLVQLPEKLLKLPKVEIAPVRVGRFRQAFDAAALEAVRRHKPDVLLRFGFGILTGEILALPRYGVWSFHHGDPEQFRGAPPGFWEIHNGDPVTGVILQRLTETLDGGTVLHAGWFRTNAASYSKSLDRILFGAAHFVGRALVDLRRDPDELLHRQPTPKSGPIYRYPRTAAVLRFLARSTAAWLTDQYVSLFRHQQWTIGIIGKSPESICAASEGSSLEADGVTWLPEPKGRFLADPFAVVRETGRTEIIAEDFSWKTGIGHVSTLPWPTAGDAEPQPAIQSAFHLSYPYTLEQTGESYCIPECAESGEVTLYRFDPQKDRWVKEQVLIQGFPALDPTIFQSEDRWWLFCTDAARGPNEFLCAWYADELTGEWRPHAANPLKVDIRGARPAGRPFMCHGQLIRPAQDCAQVYGGAVSFNRVLKLTPHEFAEEKVGKLTPDAMRYPAGLHTISGVGQQSIVDGARWTFVRDEFRRALRKKFGSGR